MSKLKTLLDIVGLSIQATNEGYSASRALKKTTKWGNFFFLFKPKVKVVLRQNFCWFINLNVGLGQKFCRLTNLRVGIEWSLPGAAQPSYFSYLYMCFYFSIILMCFLFFYDSYVILIQISYAWFLCAYFCNNLFIYI